MDYGAELGIERRLPDVSVPVDGARRRVLFATYMAETGDRAQSAIRAGYSPIRARQTAYELMQKKDVKEHIERLTKKAIAKVERRMNEQGVGEVAWIIEKAASIVEDAPKAGQYAAAVSALGLLARMHSVFNGGPSVDARSVNLNLPAGTSVDDLRGLLGGFQKQLAAGESE